jgi:hypothetical protein
LHYSYPEFNHLDLGNRNAVRVAIGNWINRHYGGFSPFGSTGPDVGIQSQPPAGEEPSAPSSIPRPPGGHGPVVIPRPPGGHGPAVPPGGDGPIIYHDYAARIHAKKYELGHGYIVLIFIGEVPEDHTQWRTCHSFVGAHCAFVNTDAEQCANCREQAEHVVEGYVHLNPYLPKRSGLPSYEHSVVTPYLRENLHWRIQSVRSFSSSSLILKTPDTPTSSGRSIWRRDRETPVFGSHYCVEQIKLRTRRSLPDRGIPGVSPPRHLWPSRRCSPLTGLKCLEIEERCTRKERARVADVSILIGCKIVENSVTTVCLVVSNGFCTNNNTCAFKFGVHERAVCARPGARTVTPELSERP